MAELRGPEQLFIIFTGRNKDKESSLRTLLARTTKVINQNYMAPGQVTIHLERGIVTWWTESWMVSNWKEGTWLSPNRFLSHYLVDLAILTMVEFGQNVLSAATKKDEEYVTHSLLWFWINIVCCCSEKLKHFCLHVTQFMLVISHGGLSWSCQEKGNWLPILLISWLSPRYHMIPPGVGISSYETPLLEWDSML